jgi:hypothetical protein
MYQPNVPPTLDDMIAGEFDFAPSIRALAAYIKGTNSKVKDLEDQVEALQNAQPPQDQAPKPTARARAPKEK